MISVTEREQKKVKGLIGNRKVANFYNGQSAAKLPRREDTGCRPISNREMSVEEGSTNRGRVSLSVLIFHLLTFIMDKFLKIKVILMESSKGVVYQIKNFRNGKSYIGCTTQNFGIRLAQHIRSIGLIKTELYEDMAENIKDFCFQIIEDNIPYSELRKHESHWIEKLQSSTNGYNQVVVSGNERLTEHEVWEIRDYVISTNLKFAEIASFYNISPALIADINLGRAWLDESLEYPLRKQTVKRKHLCEEDIHEIYSLLRDRSLTFGQIAKKLGWSSEAVLRKINNGTYNISPLPKESYPIRPVDSRKGQRNKDNGMF